MDRCCASLSLASTSSSFAGSSLRSARTPAAPHAAPRRSLLVQARPALPTAVHPRVAHASSASHLFGAQAKKKWETQPTNEKTSKPIAVKMHVKKGDKVKVISGGDKGTVSEIVEVFRKTGLVKVKDVNVKTKHVKPRQEGESGQIVRMEAPIHHSQVQHVTSAGEVSRVGKIVGEDGKKVRVLVKTGERI